MTDRTQTQEPVDKPDVGKPWNGPQGLRAFRHRNFTLYWIGQVISFSGSWVQSVAQGWLVFKLTGSALDLGIVGASSTLPTLILGLPAGAIADRYNKRKMVIITQTLAMIQAFILAALTYTGAVRVWHVMILAVFIGAVNAFDTPIRHSMIVEMVDNDKNDVMSAVSLGSAAFNGARVIGPALAGVILAAVGMANCFLINAISYVAALIALLMMTAHKFQTHEQETPMLAQIKEGLHHVIHNNLIRDLLIMTGISGLFGGQMGTVMPIFAAKVFNMGPKGLGLLMASTGVGALVGAVGTTILGHHFRQRTMVLFGGILSACGLLGFSYSPNFHMAMIILVMMGLGTMLFMAVSNSIIQEAAPDLLRGRVISLRIFVLAGLSPIGALLIGFLAQHFGVRHAVSIAGAACLLVALYYTFRSKAIRSYR
jgi:MFS family permease